MRRAICRCFLSFPAAPLFGPRQVCRRASFRLRSIPWPFQLPPCFQVIARQDWLARRGRPARRHRPPRRWSYRAGCPVRHGRHLSRLSCRVCRPPPQRTRTAKRRLWKQSPGPPLRRRPRHRSPRQLPPQRQIRPQCMRLRPRPWQPRRLRLRRLVLLPRWTGLRRIPPLRANSRARPRCPATHPRPRRRCGVWMLPMPSRIGTCVPWKASGGLGTRRHPIRRQPSLRRWKAPRQSRIARQPRTIVKRRGPPRSPRSRPGSSRPSVPLVHQVTASRKLRQYHTPVPRRRVSFSSQPALVKRTRCSPAI